MEELRIERDGFSLAASYSPAGPTALVALHGAGEGTRDSRSLRHLHELLPPHGIGVVTFDRRGEGESTGDATRGRFDLQADDALAVLGAIDVERVGLFGYSQGGWIAPIAAARSDEVAFLVLVASIGVTPSEQMMVAVERQLRLAGYGDDVVERALDLRRRFEHWIHEVAPEPDEQLDADLLAAHRRALGGPALAAAHAARRGRRRALDRGDGLRPAADLRAGPRADALLLRRARLVGAGRGERPGLAGGARRRRRRSS